MTNENDSWVDRYRPTSFKEIQGNNKALRQIRDWAENWGPGDQGQLLVGPPGTGKTTTAYVVSDVLDMPLNQINASSARKTEDIKDMAGSIAASPADGNRQLVLLDEVDGWHHAANKQPLYDSLSNPANPIILTANVEYDVPDGIKNRTNTHKFKLSSASRGAKLEDIIEAEGLDVDEHDLKRLKERPDLRSAINDLQVMAESDVPLGFDDREWEEGEFDAIPEILGGDKYAGSDISPNDLVIWLDQAVAKEYRGLEVSIAYDSLARADKWLGRAQSTRNYRYWKYAGALARMTAEVRLTEAYSGYIPGLFPDWFRHSLEKASSDTPTARVYRKLKDYDGQRYKFSGSFIYFKNVLLDILRDLDVEERRELALENRLDGDELEVLDLDTDAYEDWAGGKDSSVQEYESKSQSVLDF
jgi:replication factor C large subunit